MQEFKTRLKILRKEKKLTQIKLGEMLNYGYTAIANYESGRNQPAIADLKKIASIFDVSLDYLLGVTNVRRPYATDEDSEDFQHFQSYYTQLNPNSRQLALLFMEFLINKQQNDNESSESTPLYVAQSETEYKLN